MSNTDKDTKVYKNSGDIEIPDQLANFPGARFIEIDKDEGEGKKPKRTKWTTENNYPANHPRIQGHIRGKGNYGIATGFGWLQCLDADEFGRLKELGIIEKIPNTFTIETGSTGEVTNDLGRHYWIKVVGLKKRIVGYDPILKNKEKPDEQLHLLDVQSLGNYAIGPNSIHKSGRRYRIINDAPIAEITYEQLMTILNGLVLRKKDNRAAEQKYERKITDLKPEVEIDKIGWPKGKVEKLNGSNGTEFRGEHPFCHVSKHGRNFSINPSKGVWHCFKCDSGGGWAELLAVREGIIGCHEAGKGCLDKRKFIEVMRIAEKEGLVESWSTEEAEEAPIAEIVMERETLQEIPRKIPKGNLIVLKAPMRTGKTHRLVQWLNDFGEGNYITHKHAITEHAVKIAKELKMRGGVWVLGKNQKGACRKGDGKCDKCDLMPGQHNFLQLESRAKKLMWEIGILAPQDVPKNMCPYHTLKMAEKGAKYCFTVVNNITKIVPRKLVEIDEDPTISYFYPQSLEIATIKMRRGDKAAKNFLLGEKNEGLESELKTIMEGKNKQKKEYAAKIKEMASIIDSGKSVEDIAEDIENSLLGWTPSNLVSNEDVVTEGDNITFDACIRCMSNLYNESPVSITRKPGGYYSIYLIGDERKPRYNMEWMAGAEKIILVGATRMELFAKEFEGNREIEVENFRYAERFTVIAVHGAGGDNRKKELEEQNEKMGKIIKGLWGESEKGKRSPFMVLVGSKKKQERVVSMMKGSKAIRSEREEGMQWAFLSGEPAVYYQNSLISRGLDVDQYNINVIYDCNFAQPFWSVADKRVAAAIVSDETTNSALRISPTLRTDTGTMKIIIVKACDLPKIKYVTNVIHMNEDAETIVRVLKKMDITGVVEKEGRSGIRVNSIGIENGKGKEELMELMAHTEDLVDDDEKEMVMAGILSFMKKRKVRGSRESLSTNDIINGIRTVSKKNVVREALIDLYNKGKLVMEKKGKENRWSMRKKE
jgi:hypothetical protein